MSKETDWGTPELNALWRDHQEKEAATSELLGKLTAARRAYERASQAWRQAQQESSSSYRKWSAAMLAGREIKDGES